MVRQTWPRESGHITPAVNGERSMQVSSLPSSHLLFSSGPSAYRIAPPTFVFRYSSPIGTSRSVGMLIVKMKHDLTCDTDSRLARLMSLVPSGSLDGGRGQGRKKRRHVEICRMSLMPGFARKGFALELSL